LREIPSEGEIALFREAEARFQPIFIFVNIAYQAFTERGAINPKAIDLVQARRAKGS
jgi:hypothetical protein